MSAQIQFSDYNELDGVDDDYYDDYDRNEPSL